MAGKNKYLTPKEGIFNLHSINSTVPGTDHLQVYNNSNQVVYISGSASSTDAESDYILIDKHSSAYIYPEDLGAWGWSDVGALINVQKI